jgi:hypothetical protein
MVNRLRRNKAGDLSEEGEIGVILGHQKGDANNQDGGDGPRYHSQNRDKIGLRLELPPMSGEGATTIKQTFRVCNIGALTGSDIDKYYVDLDTVRSTQAINGVSNQLKFLDPGEPTAILFTGHRGCGKSTELQRIKRSLEQRLDERHEVIYVKATDELDINDADYKDIYLVIVKYLTQALESWGLQNSPALIQAFRDWFKEITLETERLRETFAPSSTPCRFR